MTEYIDHEKVHSLLKKYFSHTSAVGYVPKGTMLRYLIYLFLYDFTETVYPFITLKDYNDIDTLLVRLFTNGGCLLPYRNFSIYKSAYKSFVGSPVYMGKVIFRATENNSLRSTENGNFRMTE